MCCCEQRAWAALRLPGGGPSALLGPILSILLTPGGGPVASQGPEHQRWPPHMLSPGPATYCLPGPWCCGCSGHSGLTPRASEPPIGQQRVVSPWASGAGPGGGQEYVSVGFGNHRDADFLVVRIHRDQCTHRLAQSPCGTWSPWGRGAQGCWCPDSDFSRSLPALGKEAGS